MITISMLHFLGFSPTFSSLVYEKIYSPSENGIPWKFLSFKKCFNPQSIGSIIITIMAKGTTSSMPISLVIIL